MIFKKNLAVVQRVKSKILKFCAIFATNDRSKYLTKIELVSLGVSSGKGLEISAVFGILTKSLVCGLVRAIAQGP
jgi:hypothetical protein